ncbi:AraC family transcriptional regulator [Paenibacillus sp. IB182496]|uniref:AraC family transcriptional regulator n=1 Tax=Paenibacillus sabuli TaxID=2772509 RepID=A0A927BQK8_9BACL|nr:AraC family transcriptional regulator [Paenibacillus sabuli]MBD2843950.1 AraC family transcriptional regulator [Paenibacillus sabuli]
MKRFRMSGFFVTVFALSCLIGLLPLLLLGYLSYTQSATVVQDEVTEGNRMILQQNRDQVEFFLKTVDTLATSAIGAPAAPGDDAMAALLELPYRYEYLKQFESLYARLTQIQVYELGIQDVHLISYRRSWLIEGGVLYQMDRRDAADDKGRYLQRLEQQLLRYRSDSQWSYWRLESEVPHAPMLKLVKHIPLNSRDPDGLMTVNIPLSELAKRMTPGQSETMMIVDERGLVLAHTDPGQVGAQIAETPYYEEIAQRGGGDGFFTQAGPGGGYAVLHTESRYNGWRYISLTPLAQFTEQAQSIKGYTVLTILLLMLLVVLGAAAVSMRMYSPIRQIYAFVKPASGADGSNELRYIGEQVKRMVRTQHLMVDEIEMLNRQAGTFLVDRLLRGQLRAEEWEEGAERCGFPTDWAHWCVVAMQLGSLEETRYAQRDRDLLMYAVQNMIEEIVPPSRRLCPVIQSGCLLLVCGTPQGGDTPLKVEVFNRVEDIQRKIKTYLGVATSYGISRTYQELAHAPLACRESMDALAYRYRLGQESILFLDELLPERTKRLRYPKELELSLREAVGRADEAASRERLGRLVAFYAEAHLHPYDYRLCLDRLTSRLVGTVQEAGTPAHEVFPEEVFRTRNWTGLATPQETAAWLECTVLVPLLAWTREQQRSRNVHISGTIIEAIHSAYDQDVSIELFASQLNFHPNYVSRVFKKETGVTFSEYLAQYRLERAKAWLDETDMRIADIAQRLRYSTASNFNRYFKKAYGMTPGQYRERHGGGTTRGQPGIQEEGGDESS